MRNGNLWAWSVLLLASFVPSAEADELRRGLAYPSITLGLRLPR